MRLLAISGSLRDDSHNSALLRAALDRLPAGVETKVFERLADVPAFDADLEDGPVPEAVAELRDAMRVADAVLIATPEYNSSIPGGLKNALDWASRPAGESALRGVPAAVIGASTGQFGAVWAQAELRKVLTTMGGRVVDADLPVGKAHELERDVAGRLALPRELAERLDGILGELEAAAAERQAWIARQPVAA